MNTYFYVDVEFSSYTESKLYPNLLQSYNAYDQIVPDSNIKSVALYERSVINGDNISGTLLCYKWYDHENDLVMADQDKLHMILGKKYYKFLDKVKYYTGLPF